jgi:hypothetical protein
MPAAFALADSTRKLESLEILFRRQSNLAVPSLITLWQCLTMRGLLLSTIADFRSLNFPEPVDMSFLIHACERYKRLNDKLTYILGLVGGLSRLVLRKPALELEELVEDLALATDEESRGLMQDIAHAANSR